MMLYSPRTLSVTVEKDHSLLSIFPNPTNKQIGIRNIEYGQKLLITIYNFTGIFILQKDLDINHNYIDISSLPDGIYYLNIFNGSEKIGSEKLQISKQP